MSPVGEGHPGWFQNRALDRLTTAINQIVALARQLTDSGWFGFWWD
jgi:hypothetical protein